MPGRILLPIHRLLLSLLPQEEIARLKSQMEMNQRRLGRWTWVPLLAFARGNPAIH